ncbi:MAG: hypothetical protein LQ342_002786 [Letrouitia transgressa]|nr:MAG: hypothetical protein LQ342_002786 [Letrouitia transgressa]
MSKQLSGGLTPGKKVRFCNQYKLIFLAQNGGNGWATTFKIGPKDVVINLRGIRTITFNKRKDRVVLQGGALVSELVTAAYENDARVLTGNCNCIGALGAVLGGGYGRLMGLYGFGVDNLLSVSLVTSNGNLIHVDHRSMDLWWALRGAGPNFGIVTSATMKAYPTPKSKNTAWLGALVYTPDKIEALVSAFEKLALGPSMAAFMYYATTGPPAFAPSVIAFPFYVGSEQQGKTAFAPLYAVDPVADLTSVVPYNEWNAGSAPFCVKGGRKPSFGAGFPKMVPETWRAIWDEYTAFLAANPGTGNSTVLLEAYSLVKARLLPDSSASFPFRSRNRFNAVAIAWYDDPALDGPAEAFGSKVRDLLWRAADDNRPSGNFTYVNFAHGDEKLSQVYGSNVGRLQKIKKIYDPLGRFDQWFPLT